MIEIIEKETRGQNIEKNREDLPKNIRQIGEAGEQKKIYIEDYVITFMKQLAAFGDDIPKILVLYGKKEIINNTSFWFICGAIQVSDIDVNLEKTVFNETDWKQINEKANRFFGNLSVLGWVLIKKDLEYILDERVITTQKQFFRNEQQIFFEYFSNERMENIYIFENGEMNLQRGYYIYYEKNDAMQQYMLTVKQEEDGEPEMACDHAAKQFRAIVQEKKEEIHRRKTMTALYGTSTFLVMVIMVIGITMLNNYEKMRNMENVLYQISGKIEQENDNQEQDMPEEDIVSKEEVIQAGTITDTIAETIAIKEEPGAVVSGETVSEENNAENPAAVQAENRENIAEPELVENNAAEAVDVTPPPAEEIPVIPMEYEIQKGDTLAKISKQFYGNESMILKICELNGIENMDNIMYGEKILLP